MSLRHSPSTGMRKSVLALAAALVFGGGTLHAQDVNPLVGGWLGTLDVGAATLRLALSVESDDEGLSATLLSVDQGNQVIPVESITLDGDAVTFSAPAIGASYEGSLRPDRSAIEGT
ncbi:MAG: hypothetical protein OEO23_11260, partial [Gemmatimonadota bacterium]|nr:hypothetical protein [Gemmatimonadota bacterium]